MNTNITPNRNPLSALTTPVAAALQPETCYTATPTTRNGHGFHRSGKPTEGAAQWLLNPSGKLPPRAFELHEKERQRFHLLAHTVPLDLDAVKAVQRIGAEIFDATYGAEGARFQFEIAAGRLEVERLTVEKGRLETDLDNIRATVEKDEAEPRLPARFSARWWSFVVLLSLLCVSSTAALIQIASLYLPTMQSWVLACTASSPWILAAVAAEVFVLVALKSDGSKRVAQIGALLVLIVGICLWLTGIFCLAAPLNVGDLSSSSMLVPDRRLAVAGQLLCELAVSFLFLTGMLGQIEYRKIILPNENRRRIADCIGKLVADLGGILRELAKAEGNLAEWTNSRAALIEEGIAITQLRIADAVLVAEIQRRRGENQHLLEQFAVEPHNQEQK